LLAENGDKQKFFIGEVAYAVKNNDFLTSPTSITSSDYRKFGKEAVVYAATGQRGCTIVLVISRRGFFIMHIWEVPVIEAGVPGGGYYKELFQKEALDAVKKGNGLDKPHKVGILNLRDQDSELFIKLDGRECPFILSSDPSHTLRRAT
jgi:hypothetical protein